MGSENLLLPFAESEPEGSRVEAHAIYSRHLPGRRGVRVYLPAGYRRAWPKRYPVLYLQDGQKLFGEPGASWGLQQVLDGEIESGRMAPLMVVGVDHGGDEGERDATRIAEYTPVADGQLGGGQAAAYGLMLVEEIVPWVARQYRARKGREQTGIGGASLGGLVSLYVGLEHRKVFGRVAALSPSLWWGGEWIYRYVESLGMNVTPKPRIWLDMGEREGVTHVARAEQLRARLAEAGWKEPEQLWFHRDAAGEHHERAWSGRMGAVLRYLFSA